MPFSQGASSTFTPRTFAQKGLNLPAAEGERSKDKSLSVLWAGLFFIALFPFFCVVNAYPAIMRANKKPDFVEKPFTKTL